MRRTAALAALLLAAAPAFGANKDIERLQFQLSSLAAQITDLQRLVQDNVAEVKRLNESLAEQGSLVRRGSQDRRTQDEAVQATLKDITDRLGEIQERMQASTLVPHTAATRSSGVDEEGFGLMQLTGTHSARSKRRTNDALTRNFSAGPHCDAYRAARA